MTSLKQLMTDNMGIKRNEASLKQALDQVIGLKQRLSLLPTDPVAEQNSSLNRFRFDRLLTLASLLLQSALTRTESRGGHYREDYPRATHLPATSIVTPLSSQADELSRNVKPIDNIAELKLNKQSSSKRAVLVAKAS